MVDSGDLSDRIREKDQQNHNKGGDAKRILKERI
jgi:hypothetical protein